MQKKTSSNFKKVNRMFWDEIAPVHFKSAGYDVKGFLKGESTIDSIQRKELGNIKGKKILHLQCHIGLDTLSLSRFGTHITGVDFSAVSIETAQKIAELSNLNAKFIISDIYDLQNNLKGKFDIVYTSYGVLCWLKDIKKWAKIISSYLKKGGFFYIIEAHPFSMVFELNKNIEPQYSYFDNGSVFWEGNSPDYSDPDSTVKSPHYEWQWTLSDIVNTLIKSGLKIEFINEYPFSFYKVFDCMKKRRDGFWELPKNIKDKLPMMFSLKAFK